MKITNEMQFTDHKKFFTDRHTVYDHSCHENVLSPTNEMQFTDRKKFFTDITFAIRTVFTDRQTV